MAYTSCAAGLAKGYGGVTTRHADDRGALRSVMQLLKRTFAAAPAAGGARRRLAQVLCAWALYLGAAPAAALEGDLFVTLRGDRIAPGADGGGAQAEFLTSLDSAARLLLGAAANDVGDTRWGYGILGGYYKVGDGRLNLASRWEYGRGDSAGRSFVYSKLSAGGTLALVTSRLFLDLEYQSIRSLSTADEVGRIGVTVATPFNTSLKIAHDRSIGSGDDTDSWLGRLDYSGPVRGYFLGASTGTVPVDPLVSAAGREDTHLVFAGVSLPFKDYRLTVSLTHQNGSGADRTSLFLSFRLPVGR